MLSDVGLRPAIGSVNDGFNNDDLGRELGTLLREQRQQEASDRERELSLYRSGSAPPTVEGSLAAVGGLFGKNDNGLLSEEELRSDPAYLSYYYSHVNLNPRLPPPILSKEDWRFAQRLQQANSSSLGGVGDRRKVVRNDEGASRSLFSKQPGFDMESETAITTGQVKVPGAGDWKDKGGGLIGLPGITLGRQKSFVEILQDDVGRTTPIPSHPSRPTSRNTFDSGIEPIGKADVPHGFLNDIGSRDGMPHGGSIQNLSGIQTVGTPVSQTFASVLSSSLSRSNTLDSQLVARVPSPGLPPVGTKPGAADKRTASSFSGCSDPKDSDDLVAALSGMDISSSGDIDERTIAKAKLQRDNDNHHSYLFGSHVIRSHNKDMDSSSALNPGKLSFPDLAKGRVGLDGLSSSHMQQDGPLDLHMTKHSSCGAFSKGSSIHSVRNPGGSPFRYLNGEGANTAFGNYGLSGYSLDPASMLASQLAAGSLPPLLENTIAASGLASPIMNSRPLGSTLGGSVLQNNNITDNAAAASLQIPLLDPLYVQYLRDAEYAAQATGFGDPSIERAYMGSAYTDLLGMQKGYLSSLLHSQKQYDTPFLGKSGGLNHGYYGNVALGLGMPYPGSPLASSIRSGSPVGPASPLHHGESSLRFASGMHNFSGGVMNTWHSDISGSMDGTLASSLLDEFKNNKTKCYELSSIATHVVEFSADQFGSRFIQQKLETATMEEKNMVFDEIMPHSLTLMTDVFGNYVVQKFFDHGSPAQIRELAEQLIGNVLALSLQMYGCRVIQKAIEVVDLDQKAKMVKELDGHVMRCVRDQNGNHVIQKCIECIPQDAIQFIVTSFYGQVVNLSMHPYGCRVIQRVLEHCYDPKTQQIVMDEIMQCICGLAQDQYGNYVVQHVLEHGKPHERSAIIEKLAGQIVQMSQQKFASNVIEKCLSFGELAERQMIVNEMLGTTDENEPLQAMMKDQFANYVVQKVLETCDDQQRELILSRIKVHLNALKKYTYGKHIVARVEKLVAAGERRIAMRNSHTS